ncbi:MAG: nitroreductase [Woeseiaceae bacterium]|nr:nitroreductase [Woeseiaceae bacterium]
MTTADPRRAKLVNSLLRAAILAPSSHNTQPWIFEVSGKRLLLFADRTRALPANDPDDRELTMSCGCALMNLRIAAAHAGQPVRVDTLPNPGDEDLMALVDIEDRGDVPADDALLFAAIDRRHTYRKRFDARIIPPTLLESLGQAVRQEGAWLFTATDAAMRDDIADLVAEGDAIQWANPSWRRELAAWMHPRRKGDGLTMPELAAPVARMVVRTFDMGKGVGAGDSELAEESPVLAILGTDGDSVAEWLRAGQALQRLLLTACVAGVQASFLNQPVQVAALRSKLQHRIGRPGFPQVLVRLGYPTEDVRPAPRRELADVVE